MEHLFWLEQRRELLKGAIAYVEEQHEFVSQDTIGFVSWARAELTQVERSLIDDPGLVI